MHSPGEIAQVASLYDSRIFEEPSASSEPNIEFHIHAFLNPNSNRRQEPPAPAGPSHVEMGVGPAGNQE